MVTFDSCSGSILLDEDDLGMDEIGAEKSGHHELIYGKQLEEDI